MAIAFDAITGSDTSGSSLTVSHTCTGSNLVLFACALVDGNKTISSITYNGVAMTLATSHQFGSELLAIYYMTNPPTGAHNVVLTCSGSNNPSLRNVSYTGVLATVQPDNSNSNTGSNTSLSNSLTSVVDNCWHMMIQRNTTDTVGAGSGTTNRGAGGGNGVVAILDNNGAIHPAGSNTIIGTGTATQTMNQVSITIAATDNNMSISVNDALTVTESVVLTNVYTISINDSITITESVTVFRYIAINVSDTETITESITVQNIQLGNISVNDALTITESRSVALALDLQISDVLLITESVTMLDIINLSVNDTETISENISMMASLGNISVSDAITISESRTLVVSDKLEGLAIMRGGDDSYPLGMDDQTML